MKRQFFLTICPVLTLAALMLPGSPRQQGTKNGTSAPPAATSANQQNVARMRVGENFGKLPLYFIENRGQLDRRVAFYAQGSDKAIYFTDKGLTFALSSNPQNQSTSLLQPASLKPSPPTAGSRSRYTLKLDFVNARTDLHPTGQAQTPAVFSYFRGSREQWKAGLKSYAQIVYKNIWPGIDLVYAGTVNQMKYSFIVKPGANPQQIRLAYRGATGLRVSQGGQLEVQTPVGGFSDEQPVSWQEANGQRLKVATSYHLEPATRNGEYKYGFKLGDYNRDDELIIDPAILIYCGYLGGSNFDRSMGIALDNAGNAYLTGDTVSSETQGFPVVTGPDLTYNEAAPNLFSDVFVAKIKADGTGLIYCGYLGGRQSDIGRSIAVDSAGNAYLTGETRSSESQGFPVTVGPDTTYNGSHEVFVAKVNSHGTGLDFCGYLGGDRVDVGLSIAVDSAGNAYLTGDTDSSESQGFPVTGGPDTTYNGGNSDAFVAKVKADGTGLVYCGYIGGSSDDFGEGIAVDIQGNAYLTGHSNSSETQGFPVTVGPDTTYNGGNSDAFVIKVNADGSGLHFCGYIGGSIVDVGLSIAVDRVGDAYITGHTDSPDFTSVVGPDTIYNGNSDVFVAKVKADGTGLVYCGYIGGSSDDFGEGIAVDIQGNAYLTGGTFSSEGQGFPVIGGPDITFNNAPGSGNDDAFVAKVKADGTGLDYCGYVGGGSADNGFSIAVDAAGNAYITGYTSSRESIGFPATLGPDTTFNGGDFDAFVAKIGAVNQPPTVDTDGPYIVYEGSLVTVSASGIDLDGDALTYAWDLDNDGTFEIMGQRVTFSAAALDGPSLHTIQVQVTDSDGLQAGNQTTVKVLNVGPKAILTNLSGAITAGQSATFVFIRQSDPSAADEAARFRYSYDCTDDGKFEIKNTASRSHTCAYPLSGRFTARGRIRDKDGGFTDYTVEVKVRAQ